MDALTGVIEGIPQNGTPAEYVTWFAQALSALFNALMEIFGKLKGLTGGEEGEATEEE